MSKELGQRSDAELEALFSNMYSGWDRGVNVTPERLRDGKTRFTETPMTPLELAARYVAAEIGVNIYEIATRAAFAPIIVFSQIQARIGPVFDEAATTIEAKDVEIAALRKRVEELEYNSKRDAAIFAEVWAIGLSAEARAEIAEREVASAWASRALVLGSWRDIASAPKDGRALILRSTFRVGEGSWGMCRPQHNGYRANSGEPTWRTADREKIFPGTVNGWIPMPLAGCAAMTEERCGEGE